MTARPFAAALLLVVAGSVGAQGEVYRCGNEYSRTPCSQGRMVETASSVRTPAQRAEAVQVAAAEKQLAEDMARDRRRAEASIKPAVAGSLGPTRPAVAGGAKAKVSTGSKGKDKGKKKSGAESEDFVAIVPASKS